MLLHFANQSDKRMPSYSQFAYSQSPEQIAKLHSFHPSVFLQINLNQRLIDLMMPVNECCALMWFHCNIPTLYEIQNSKVFQIKSFHLNVSPLHCNSYIEFLILYILVVCTFLNIIPISPTTNVISYPKSNLHRNKTKSNFHIKLKYKITNRKKIWCKKW